MDAWEVRIAPGRSSIAVARLDPQLATLDVWTYDGERPLPRRVSPAIDRDESPAWSRDGTRVAWVSGRHTVTMRGALAELPDVALHKFEYPSRVTDWSPDGRWIVVSESRPDTHDDLWLLPPNGQDQPRPYVQSPFNESQGAVSPDGRWMAYASDESGRFEIYVDSFPTPGTRGRLTIGGGTEPRWRADGGEIFFRRGSEIHSVKPLLSATAVEAASSERLFDAGADVRSFDVTSDGQRFLLNLPAPDNTPPSMRVIVNLSALLPRPR
jgi:Tol biopolymer transport system component